MGTTSASGRVRRVPWDVPVRLVRRAMVSTAGTDAAPQAPQAPGQRGQRDRPDRRDRPDEWMNTHAVDIGVRLPGIAGVSVTTVTVEGRRLLSAIQPAPGPSAPRAPSPRAVALHDLLEELEVDGAVPVLVEGTAFALAVLDALTSVAAGERCSYAELAARAGRPRAVRAAAHVMATNRVPLVLPCHRVVPSGGGTGRYSWGDTVKPVLLDAEREGTV